MKMKHRALTILLAIAMLLTFTPAMAFADSGVSAAETGAKEYRYRYDISPVPEEYTKLGIALFPGDTLKDCSEDTRYEQDGCVYNGYYMGFTREGIDSSVCDVTERTKDIQTTEGGDTKTYTGVESVTVKGGQVVVVDGADDPPVEVITIMSNGVQVMENQISYKGIRVRTLADYGVEYELDGGEWGGIPSQNTNPETLPLTKDDTVYRLAEPKKEGFIFAGWTLENDYGAATIDGDDLTVEGLYRENEKDAQAQVIKHDAVMKNGGKLKLTANWIEAETVWSLSFDVERPEAGSATETPYDKEEDQWLWAEQTNSPQYTISDGSLFVQRMLICNWASMSESSERVEPYQGTFEAGKEYPIYMFILMKEGCRYPENTEDFHLYINGVECEDINITAVLGKACIMAEGTVKAADCEHEWEKDYTVDTPATYGSAGSRSIHCRICGASDPDSVQAIPKLTVPATKITKATGAKKAFTVKWSKKTGVTGYEIQYGLKSSFKGAKTAKVNSAASVSKKIKKLKAKKTYYVRVRSFKNEGGKTYYSSWSAKKKVKTK